jgi:hypothetical protein
MTPGTSIGWTRLPPIPTRPGSSVATARLRRSRAGVIWDLARLTGIAIGYPEVQTVLDGAPVPGVSLVDRRTVSSIGAALDLVTASVEAGTWGPLARPVGELWSILHPDEATTPPATIEPPLVPHPYHQALVACAARAMTPGAAGLSLLVAAGDLIATEYDAISVAPSRLVEFRERLDDLRSGGDATGLLALLAASPII